MMVLVGNGNGTEIGGKSGQCVLLQRRLACIDYSYKDADLHVAKCFEVCMGCSTRNSQSLNGLQFAPLHYETQGATEFPFP